VPQFAVHPDDLDATAASGREDVGGLAAASAALGTTAIEATAAVGPAAPALDSALQAYLHVETVVAAALAEATAVLAGGLAVAATRYAEAEGTIGANLRGVRR
jgi:hypothetical protein